MCGIWGLFGFPSHDYRNHGSAFEIAGRGPDCFIVQNIKDLPLCTIAFHRLAVVDSVRGFQPMRLVQFPHLTLMCNGEIYNFEKLRDTFKFEFESQCDCEIILHLYNKFGIEKTCQLLDGVFALMILDTKKQQVNLARDTYGVRPMFYFNTKSSKLGFCSEAKGLCKIVDRLNEEKEETSELLQIFPPASFHVYDLYDGGKAKLKDRQQFHKFADRPEHWKHQDIDLAKGDSIDIEAIKSNIRTLLTKGVEKRLMSTRRVGSLLSGGLDSSLVAAITAKKFQDMNMQYPLLTFSIGMENSPDVVAARKVAKHIGSDHHEVSFTDQEGIEAIKNVIYSLESYDVTTVRASTPMYLLSKYISEKTDTIVIMSGEGADELAQGYVYFHKQPSPEEGDEESRRLLKDLYMFDVLRTDRVTAVHGLEVRAPFLDHAFTSYYLSVPPALRSPKDGIEKHLLRSAFAESELIPADILWRPKEAFSDGVSSKKKSWFEILQQHIESQVSDEELASAASLYPHHTPQTKEAYFYRRTFSEHFGDNLSRLIPYQWLPRWCKEGTNDPSARVLEVYKNDEE